MPDIDTKEMRDRFAIRYTTHSRECWKWHAECAIHRLCDRVDGLAESNANLRGNLIAVQESCEERRLEIERLKEQLREVRNGF